MTIANTEVVISGRLLRIAKLRHEWFEYLDNPQDFIEEVRRARIADLFTFLQEAHVRRPALSFHNEPAPMSLLTFSSFDEWWKGLHFKARNKARKAQKTGVELRTTRLDDDFVHGVERIYNEWPIRQGRKFWHYGKSFETIKRDLSSFPECTTFVGAYHQNQLVGFMKLFEGNKILRFVHIISKLSERDKCIMDALIAKSVEICSERKVTYLHYGDWAYRGLGTFREKFGFDKHICPRYCVPLNKVGELALKLGLHRSIRERLPRNWLDQVAGVRERWYSWKYGQGPVVEAS